MNTNNGLTGKELKRLYELLFVKANDEQRKAILKELKNKVNPCCSSCGEPFESEDFLTNGLCPDCEIERNAVM